MIASSSSRSAVEHWAKQCSSSVVSSLNSSWLQFRLAQRSLTWEICRFRTRRQFLWARQVFDQCQNTQKAARQTLQAAKRMIAASSKPINPVATMQVEPTRITPRLPQINLPSFSGDFTAWLSFIDQFRSTVNDHDTQSPVPKLTYLKSGLTSHVFKLIMNLETTEIKY